MLELLVVLAFVGFFLWLFNTLVPLDPKIKTVINGAVLFIVFLYAVNVFFPLPFVGALHLRR